MGKKFVRLRAFTGVGLGRRFDGQAQMQIRLTAGVAPTSDPPPPPRRSIPRGPPPSATSATGAPVAAARGRAMAGERGGAAQHNDAGATDHCCGVAHPAATACCGRMVSFFFSKSPMTIVRTTRDKIQEKKDVRSKRPPNQNH